LTAFLLAIRPEYRQPTRKVTRGGQKIEVERPVCSIFVAVRRHPASQERAEGRNLAATGAIQSRARISRPPALFTPCDRLRRAEDNQKER
jgi:hypothetical protein